MDISLYKPTDLETWIYQKYQKHGIYYASDMDIDFIASIFGAEIHTFNGCSFADWEEGEYTYIMINAYLKEDQKREHFFHELPHPLLHIGSQHKLPKSFIELQEVQASHFQLYAAMPIYMIKEFIYDVYTYESLEKVLAEEFVLPLPFVRKRIDQIKRRIYVGQQEKEWRERHERVVDTSYITRDYIRQLQSEFGRQRQEKERIERERLWGTL